MYVVLLSERRIRLRTCNVRSGGTWGWGAARARGRPDVVQLRFAQRVNTEVKRKCLINSTCTFLIRKDYETCYSVRIGSRSHSILSLSGIARRGDPSRRESRAHERDRDLPDRDAPVTFPVIAYTRHEHRQRGFGLCEHLLQHEGGRRSTQRSDPMLPARRPAGKPLGLQWPCTSPTHRLASPSHAPHYSYTEDVVGSPVPQ